MKKVVREHTFDYDLIVIGSGAGGSVAATMVAREGWRVAIIEESAFGGDLSNWGDIPTKALLESAHLYQRAKDGQAFGLRSSTLGFNYPAIRAWKELVVKRTGVDDDRSFYTKQGIATFQGKAHFLTPHEITVNRRHLSARHFLVASGAEWKIPNIPGLKEATYHTPRTILESIRPPKSLLVIGGSRQAVEIAQLMAIFGTKVYLVQSGKRLLPSFDPAVGEHLASSLSKQLSVMTDTQINSVVKEGSVIRVLLYRGGAPKHIIVDEILVADQETPNVDLGLDNAIVKYSDKGIETDQYLRTSAKHIYAAGDCLGSRRDAHATILESRIVAHNLTQVGKVRPDYDAMPRLVLSMPEIAQVGLTVAEAKRLGLAVKQATTPLSVISASNVHNSNEGFVSLVVDGRGVIRGGTVMAPQASEVIQEISLAVKNKLTATDLAHTPHVFLSWSEAVRLTAQKLMRSGIV